MRASFGEMQWLCMRVTGTELCLYHGMPLPRNLRETSANTPVALAFCCGKYRSVRLPQFASYNYALGDGATDGGMETSALSLELGGVANVNYRPSPRLVCVSRMVPEASSTTE